MSKDIVLDTLDFVACPNVIHVGEEGWKSYKLFYAGNGTIKCQSCGRTYTIDDIGLEIEREGAYRKQLLTGDYRMGLARLELDKQENIERLQKLTDL